MNYDSRLDRHKYYLQPEDKHFVVNWLYSIEIFVALCFKFSPSIFYDLSDDENLTVKKRKKGKCDEKIIN